MRFNALAVTIGLATVPTLAGAQETKPCTARGGEIQEAIVGFQQSGASAAEHKQSYFFDFFISRPVPIAPQPCPDTNVVDAAHAADTLYGPRLRWWGNVRLASYPQQVTAAIGTFAADLGTSAASVPVNQLVQTAEFVTGLEWRFAQFNRALDGNDRDERQLFALSVFGGGGASSPLDPNETLHIYETPAASSPQRAAFVAAYPAAANSPYVGFVEPDRDRFFRQYSVGLRLTTLYAKKGKFGQPDEPYLAAPAMLSVSFGQNEMVTGGRLDGVVGRFEAFYPLLIAGDRSDRSMIVYLFGSALLRLGSANQTAPFILKEVDTTVVHGYDPTVAIVPAATNRDTYMIGFGIELTHVFKKPGA